MPKQSKRENFDVKKWLYLVDQAHPWKRQLFIKVRKLTAAAVWSGMLVNNM